MKFFRSHTAAMLAAAAAFSLVATPVMARGWHRHRDNGIDAGDLLAGVLIIGGIAAIATAASNRGRKDREAGEDDRYRDDYRADDYRELPRGDYGAYGDEDRAADRPGSLAPADNGEDAAVDACMDEIERDRGRVDGIEGVDREGEGWRVSGRARGGRDFTCSVDPDGRVWSVEGL